MVALTIPGGWLALSNPGGWMVLSIPGGCGCLLRRTRKQPSLALVMRRPGA
jgi:hypothetical protein